MSIRETVKAYLEQLRGGESDAELRAAMERAAKKVREDEKRESVFGRRAAK